MDDDLVNAARRILEESNRYILPRGRSWWVAYHRVTCCDALRNYWEQAVTGDELKAARKLHNRIHKLANAIAWASKKKS